MCVALSPCTRFAILGCANNLAQMYDVISGQRMGSMAGHTNWWVIGLGRGSAGKGRGQRRGECLLLIGGQLSCWGTATCARTDAKCVPRQGTLCWRSPSPCPLLQGGGCQVPAGWQARCHRLARRHREVGGVGHWGVLPPLQGARWRRGGVGPPWVGAAPGQAVVLLWRGSVSCCLPPVVRQRSSSEVPRVLCAHLRFREFYALI